MQAPVGFWDPPLGRGLGCGSSMGFCGFGSGLLKKPGQVRCCLKDGKGWPFAHYRLYCLSVSMMMKMTCETK